MPVWDLIILLPSKTREFLFHLFFVLSTPFFPADMRKVGIPFTLLCSTPGEGGRGSWWTGQSVSLEEDTPRAQTFPEKYVPLVLWPRANWTFQQLSLSCLISQTLLLFHSWLPLPCFIDTVFPIAHVQNRLLVLFLFFLFCFGVFFVFSTCVCDSPRICCVLS